MLNLATSKRDGQGEGRVSLNAVVAECAQVIQNAAITDGALVKTTLRQKQCTRQSIGKWGKGIQHLHGSKGNGAGLSG